MLEFWFVLLDLSHLGRRPSPGMYASQSQQTVGVITTGTHADCCLERTACKFSASVHCSCRKLYPTQLLPPACPRSSPYKLVWTEFWLSIETAVWQVGASGIRNRGPRCELTVNIMTDCFFDPLQPSGEAAVFMYLYGAHQAAWKYAL